MRWAAAAAVSAALLLFGCHGAGAQAPPAGWGLPVLMAQMAQVRAATGSFTERKTLRLLNAPLIATGTLTYVAPDYLKKQATAPGGEVFVLDHGAAVITGGPDGQIQKFALKAAPQIGGLVEGIRATLAGDLPALQTYYGVQLQGDPTAWQLTLRPKNPASRRFVSWIMIRGSGNRIDTIDTAAGNGDHSEMGIAEDIDVAK